MELIVNLLLQGLQMMLVILVAPGLMGLVQKVRARLLLHQGPPVWQPYLDLWRLLRKEALVAHNASWLFRVAPYLIFAAVWVAAALVPIFATGLTFSWSADILAIVALLGTARFAMALAGMDVGTSFGGLGSSREMMVASLAEPAMLMIVFTVALVAGTTQLSNIAEFMETEPIGLRVSLALALVALIIVSVAENARIPVDNPSTHLEVTMIHEAMILEYSGRHLALIEAAAATKLLLYISLIICLFFPFGTATVDSSLWAQFLGIILWLIKLAIGGFFLAAGEVLVSKMRLFRVADLLGGALILSLLAMIFLFVSKGI
ncbi:MAG: NADH-quinone oxidoreductase subunit H [Rhodobacterales bacterium]